MSHEAAIGVTYSSLIVDALTRYPNREAFVDGDRRVTYAETADTTSRLTQVLAKRGIGPGGAVGVLSPNAPEAWMAQAATCLLGGSYSGLHPLGSIDDHVYLCDDAGLDILVVHPQFVEAGSKIAARSRSVRHLLTLGPTDAGEDILALCSETSARQLEAGPAGEEDTAWLQYTGGTTGRSKGVELPHRALVQMVQSVTVSASLPETPRYLASSPITHAAVQPILSAFVRGGTVVLHQSFDPERWLHTVEQERINYAFAVPTMLHTMLDQCDPKKYDVSSLETIIYGGSPMSASRITETHEALGPVLLQAYGQTECVSFITTLRNDEHDPVNRPDLLSSCGRPVVGVRADVLDDDNQPVSSGDVGEICVRSRGVMNGYRNQPEQTTAALHGGWLHTGDLAYRDDSGFFHIVDRKKDMIISGGFNVYPREVEDTIATIPEVSAVAIIGVPDDKWGEAVTAFVVPRPGADVDVANVRELVRDKKGAHQAPKEIVLVDQLPTTATGKIDKRSLREQFWSGEGRRVH